MVFIKLKLYFQLKNSNLSESAPSGMTLPRQGSYLKACRGAVKICRLLGGPINLGTSLDPNFFSSTLPKFAQYKKGESINSDNIEQFK